MLGAKEIANNPSKIDEVQTRAQIILDTTTDITFDNMNKAVGLMVEKGWKPVAMTGFHSPPWRLLYVILQRS